MSERKLARSDDGKEITLVFTRGPQISGRHLTGNSPVQRASLGTITTDDGDLVNMLPDGTFQLVHDAGRVYRLVED